MKIEDIASSGARLTIASQISVRPRTLSELAEATGISVQAVLKHLDKLRRSGFLADEELTKNRYMRYRKVYSSARGRRVGDYSDRDLMVAHLSAPLAPEEPTVANAYEELESIAEEVIVLRKRVRDLSRRMGRLTRELASDQERFHMTVGALGLDPEERQIASVFFTEHGAEEAKRILSRHYGCKDADRAVRETLKKIRER